MKKILYGFSMTISVLVMALLILVTLHYYGAVTFSDLTFLPVAERVIDFSSNDTISGVIGFSTIREVGRSFILLSIYVLFGYFMIMATTYQFNNISRQVLFWCNVVIYSFGFSLLLIGFLFNFLEL